MHMHGKGFETKSMVRFRCTKFNYKLNGSIGVCSSFDIESNFEFWLTTKDEAQSRNW